jgi:hypothetical protein
MPTHLQDLLDDFRRRCISRSSQEPLALPELAGSVYAEAMSHFDARLESKSYRTVYRNRKSRPDQIVNEVDLAGEMWSYFPTHFFKFRQTLAELTLPKAVEGLARSIFGCTRFTVLDIGAGVGTASLATIDLVHEWQGLLLSSGHAPALVRLTLQPVETNPLKLSTLKRMVETAARQVRPDSLRIDLRPPITIPYPEEACLRAVEGALAEGGPHLLVTLSNILTWIRDWRPPGQGHLARLWRWVMDALSTPKLPSYLLQTLVLLNELRFDLKTVTLVETEDAGGKLARDVDVAVAGLAARLAGVERNASGSGRITFINPPESKWRFLGYSVSPPVSFHRGLCEVRAPAFRRQQLLQEALAPDTVRLACPIGAASRRRQRSGARTRSLPIAWRGSTPIRRRIFSSCPMWNLRTAVRRRIPT